MKKVFFVLIGLLCLNVIVNAQKAITIKIASKSSSLDIGSSFVSHYIDYWSVDIFDLEGNKLKSVIAVYDRDDHFHPSKIYENYSDMKNQENNKASIEYEGKYEDRIKKVVQTYRAYAKRYKIDEVRVLTE